jgi:hypothetical protein
MISSVINVDFDFEFLPRDFITRLVQTAAARCRPEHGELRRTQLDLAFLAGCAPTDFERERRRLALFSQPNMPPAPLVREIALGQSEMARSQNLEREPLDQEFSFDLARGNVVRAAHGFDSNVSGAARQDLIREKVLVGCRITSAAGFILMSILRGQRRKRSRAHVVAFANSTGQREGALIEVKRIAVIITAGLLSFGCGWFGPAEKYKTESGRTTYRAAEENPATRPDVTPSEQKIPGESPR